MDGLFAEAKELIEETNRLFFFVKDSIEEERDIWTKSWKGIILRAKRIDFSVKKKGLCALLYLRTTIKL
jgi:hypothetical protein